MKKKKNVIRKKDETSHKGSWQMKMWGWSLSSLFLSIAFNYYSGLLKNKTRIPDIFAAVGLHFSWNRHITILTQQPELFKIYELQKIVSEATDKYAGPLPSTVFLDFSTSNGLLKEAVESFKSLARDLFQCFRTWILGSD